VNVCIIDTSVLVELLGVPGYEARHDECVADFELRARAPESFLLPLPVLFETGNHVAQIPDGRLRRAWAERLVSFARPALSGESPFTLTPAPLIPDVISWLADFADYAMKKVGLVDRSLIDLFERQRALMRSGRVYIWSRDLALMGYDTQHG